MPIMGQTPSTASAGKAGGNDTTWIPANVPHRFINASETEPMRIFWVYASIDATRTMIATGEEQTIDAEHGQEPGASK